MTKIIPSFILINIRTNNHTKNLKIIKKILRLHLFTFLCLLPRHVLATLPKSLQMWHLRFIFPLGALLSLPYKAMQFICFSFEFWKQFWALTFFQRVLSKKFSVSNLRLRNFFRQTKLCRSKISVKTFCFKILTGNFFLFFGSTISSAKNFQLLNFFRFFGARIFSGKKSSALKFSGEIFSVKTVHKKKKPFADKPVRSCDLHLFTFSFCFHFQNGCRLVAPLQRVAMFTNHKNACNIPKKNSPICSFFFFTRLLKNVFFNYYDLLHLCC